MLPGSNTRCEKYVKNISLKKDLGILIATIKKVFTHEDVATNTEEIDEGYLDEIRGVAERN